LRDINASARQRAHGAGMSALRTGRLIGGAVVAAVIVSGVWLLMHRPPAVGYVTAPVTRGDVVTTIGASGSVNPVVTVQVGTYVSGVIQALSCDYNTRVHKGQLCAKIDPGPYQVIVDEDRAQLDTGKAQLVKDQANQAYTKITRQRAELLFQQDSIAHDAVDAAQSADKQALSVLDLDKAQIVQREGVLKAALINLAYTDIVSPVDGTVVSRNVTAGQTVAASFQTPTLFLIAKDLTQMQVDTNVSESDIAGAVQGAGASFTVDAYPGHPFRGKVTQVRQAPISVQNVITYDVVITTANPDFLLKPGMTATAKINTAQALNVLRVPSQALRFTPVGAAKPPTGQRRQTAARRVWLLRSGKPAAVSVVVGLDDDRFAEIKGGELKPGDEVIVSQATGKSAQSAAPRPSLRL
jgi:HlyD family secretion protein